MPLAPRAPATFSLDRLLEEAGDLPVLPDLAVTLLERLRGDDSSPREIAAIVQKEPVIAASVLRVANSALFGGTGTISDLSYAMVRIGMRHVRNLVLALVLRSRLADRSTYGEEGAEILAHSIATGLAARLLAEEAGEDEAEAFLCGLVHDLGKLALIKAIRARERLVTPRLSPRWRQVVDDWHTRAGERLGRSWGLPEPVVAAAAAHHDPAADPCGHRTTWLVAMANELVHAIGVGGPADPDRQTRVEELRTGVGIDAAGLLRAVDYLPGLFETTTATLFSGGAGGGAVSD